MHCQGQFEFIILISISKIIRNILIIWLKYTLVMYNEIHVHYNMKECKNTHYIQFDIITLIDNTYFVRI